MNPRVAEFFAGIGLVRHAVEQEDFRVVFANDIERSKASIYAANFDDAHFVLDDVGNVRAKVEEKQRKIVAFNRKLVLVIP